MVNEALDMILNLWGHPGEGEIAYPGALPWNEVFGFRRSVKCLFTGPVYLRQGFAARNPTAYQQIYELLSGKPQA